MTLSDKRQELSNYGLEPTESLGGAAKFYKEEDVKEFIKELKKEIDNLTEDELFRLHHERDIKKLIDKLAGDKLK